MDESAYKAYIEGIVITCLYEKLWQTVSGDCLHPQFLMLNDVMYENYHGSGVCQKITLDGN